MNIPNRTNSSDPTFSTPIRLEPWFNDGNIVIWAENTQFRVHRGVLSRHSVIFKDMFSLAAPAAGAEAVDGCPVVQLSDTAVDVQHVLNALYENRSFNFNDPKPEPLSVVAAFLRLGKKYEIDSLRTEAEHRLVAHFPSSLKDWDRRLRAIGPSLIQYYPGLEFDVANLARDQNFLLILPVALYACSLFGMREILCGISIGSGKFVSLSSYDRDVCLLGRDRLISEQQQRTFRWLGTEDKLCIEEIGCSEGKVAIGIPVLSCVALMPWQSDWETFLCGPCAHGSRKIHDINRAAVWSELPSYFELPPWAELLEQS